MIDPMGKQHTLMVEENDSGSLQIGRGVLRMASYYKLKNAHIIHLKFLGSNNFQFRIYYDLYKNIFYCSNPPEVQRRYYNEQYKPDDFFYSTDKTLFANDVKSSSLVNDILNSDIFENIFSSFCVTTNFFCFFYLSI